jgi:hypothetical protein
MTMSIFSTIVAATGVGGTPNPSGLPGSTALESLISGLAFWALSSHSGNYHHSALGRRGTVISAVSAFLVGAAPAIIGFFEDLGRTVH